MLNSAIIDCSFSLGALDGMIFSMLINTYWQESERTDQRTACLMDASYVSTKSRDDNDSSSRSVAVADAVCDPVSKTCVACIRHNQKKPTQPRLGRLRGFYTKPNPNPLWVITSLWGWQRASIWPGILPSLICGNIFLLVSGHELHLWASFWQTGIELGEWELTVSLLRVNMELSVTLDFLSLGLSFVFVFLCFAVLVLPTQWRVNLFRWLIFFSIL